MKKIKLTPKLLNRIINEEKQRLEKLGLLQDSKVKENVDYIKKLSIAESRLKKKLKLINVIKKRLSKS